MLEERTKLAFDSAYKTVAQLITLATATIAIEVSLLKDLAFEQSRLTQTFAVGSWAFFLFSIVCGVGTSLGLTGDLDLHSPGGAIADTDLSIYKKRTRVLAALQILLFIAGLILTIALGFVILGSTQLKRAGKPC
jgi:hypothetical protein